MGRGKGLGGRGVGVEGVTTYGNISNCNKNK